MIYYTLLPEKEIKVLKREYKTRLCIFLLFFLSCSVLLGTASLIPAYIFSYVEAKEATVKVQTLQKSRQEGGVNSVSKEIGEIDTAIKTLKNHEGKLVFSRVIEDIVSMKSAGITIASLQFSLPEVTAEATVSTYTAIVQGKSTTRENLVNFKKKLELDPTVQSVELPVSDLAKSKDISYSLKIIMKIPK